MSPDSLFSLSGFQKSLLISVYQIRRRISAAPRPTLTKGNPLFPASPFVPRPACFLLLRRGSPCFPLLHSYRDQLASCSYEGSASFSRLTIRIRARQALPPTKGIPLFPAIPFVPRPACFLLLRRVSFLFASHSRILCRQALPLTKGIPLFPASPFVPRPTCSLHLRRVSFLFASHSRIPARQALPLTKGILRFPASPFVPRPACSLLLRRVSFLLASHHSYPRPAGSASYEGYLPVSRHTIRTASSLLPLPTKGQLPFRVPPFVSPPAKAFRCHDKKKKPGISPGLSSRTTSSAATCTQNSVLHPLRQPRHSVISIYPHCASLSTVIYPFSSTAPITQETL